MQVAALDILTTKGRFAPEVARAIGEAMDLQIESTYEGLATAQQLSDTRVGLERLYAELKSEVIALELRVNAKIEAVKVEVLRWMFVAMPFILTP